MTWLPYTELHVPTTRLRTTHTRLLADGSSLATLQDGDAVLGHLTLAAHTIEVDVGPAQHQRLIDFAAQCQTTCGQYPPREEVLRELVMEYRYAQAITEAAQSEAPTVAVRAFHTDGTITLHRVEAPAPLGPGPELKVDPALFTTDVTRAQAWMRDLWMRVTPRTATDRDHSRTQLTRLPHTGLHIPAKFPLWVSDLTEKGDDQWSAQVWVHTGGEPVRLGNIAGHGQNVTFEGETARAVKVLLTYALMSLEPEGKVLEWQELARGLAREYQMARETTRAQQRGYYLVQLTRTGQQGPSTDLVGIMDALPGGTYPDYAHARTCAATFADDPQVIRVQLWVSGAWVDVTPPRQGP